MAASSGAHPATRAHWGVAKAAPQAWVGGSGANAGPERGVAPGLRGATCTPGVLGYKEGCAARHGQQGAGLQRRAVACPDSPHLSVGELVPEVTEGLQQRPRRLRQAAGAGAHAGRRAAAPQLLGRRHVDANEKVGVRGQCHEVSLREGERGHSGAGEHAHT